MSRPPSQCSTFAASTDSSEQDWKLATGIESISTANANFWAKLFGVPMTGMMIPSGARERRLRDVKNDELRRLLRGDSDVHVELAAKKLGGITTDIDEERRLGVAARERAE